jgi:hypothetical protein
MSSLFCNEDIRSGQGYPKRDHSAIDGSFEMITNRVAPHPNPEKATHLRKTAMRSAIVQVPLTS